MAVLRISREIKMLFVVLALLGFLAVSVAVSAEPALVSPSNSVSHNPPINGHQPTVNSVAVSKGVSTEPAMAAAASTLASAALFDPPPPITPTDGLLWVTDTDIVTFTVERTTSSFYTPAGSRVITVSNSSGFTAGHEILIIDMQGSGLGTHETAIVSAVATNVLTLTGDLEHEYDGTTDKIMVQRVPYYSGVLVESGGKLTVDAWDGETGGMIFFRAVTATVEGDGSIDVSESGFGSGSGPCAGTIQSSGGCYGGWGSLSAGIPYGSVHQPSALGSGGKAGADLGGAGGGAIHLIIDDCLILEGSISANGASTRNNNYGSGGGGAGGSIWIETGVISGTSGYIRANGGSAGHGYFTEYGGGSGGRIALYANRDAFSDTSHLQAFAGGGLYGGPGTIYRYTEEADELGKLYVGNSSHDGRPAAIVPGNYQFDAIALAGNGHLTVLGTTSVITLTNGDATGDGTSRLACEGTIAAPEAFTISQVVVDVQGQLSGPKVITTAISGGLRLHAATPWHSGAYTYTRLYIGEGTVVSADGQGDPAKTGDGTPTSGRGGAGYGGQGGMSGADPGGPPYGDLYRPVELGSGGGGPKGGAGGGPIYLVITGTLTVNGAISANGSDGLRESTFTSGDGGGSGGSILIETSVITGSGVIRANGGNGASSYTGPDGGSGAGGRIAIYAEANSFQGVVQALGATDYYTGENGTVYLNRVDPNLSTIVAQPGAGMEANGVETSTITVKLVNTNGITMPNEAVSLEIEQGTNSFINNYPVGQGVPISIGSTHGDGTITATLASTKAEVKVVRAWAGQVELVSAAVVTFTAGPPDIQTSLVSATPDHIPADGTSPATVTVQLFDQYQNPVPGVSVALTHTGGVSITLGQPASPTGADGKTTGTIRGGTPQVVTVQAVVSGTTIVDTAQVTFVGADLAVTKSGPDVVLAGDLFTYTLTVRNEGYLPAEGVILTDTLPTGLNLVTYTAPSTFSQNGQTLTWQMGTIDDGQQVTAALVVTATSTIPHGTSLWNHLEAATQSPELDLANNSFQERTVIHQPMPKLLVAPSYSEVTVRHGTTQTMTLTVQNIGTGAATGVYATPPPYVDWITVTDELPKLAPGASATAVVTLCPPTNLPSGVYRDLVTFGATEGSLHQAALAVWVVDITRTLGITVTDGSDPVPEANVYLVRKEETFLVTEGVVSTVHQQARGTGTDGVAVLEGLEAGTYDYVATAPGYGAAQSTVTVTAGTEPQWLTVTLSGLPLLVPEPFYPAIHTRPGETGSFEAAVRNVGLGTAENLEITLPDAPDWLYVGIIGLTDELTTGEALSVTLLASPPLTLNTPYTLQQYVYVSMNGVQATRFALSVYVDDRPTGTMQLLVTDPDGVPVEGALISLVNQQEYDRVSGETDAGGLVSFQDIPEGSYDAYADAEGYESSIETTPVVEPGGTILYNVTMIPESFTAVWSVDEITLTDKYSVTVDITFKVGRLQILPLQIVADCDGETVTGIIQVRNPLTFPVTNVLVIVNAPGLDFNVTGPDTIEGSSVANYWFSVAVPARTFTVGWITASADHMLDGRYPVLIASDCLFGGGWSWNWTWDGGWGFYYGAWPSFPGLGGHLPDDIVKLRLSQMAMLDRQAFLATLRLQNGPEQIEDLKVRITAREGSGSPQPEHFVITPTVPTLLGNLGPGITIQQVWTMVPHRPDITEPTTYTIRATLLYTDVVETHVITSFPEVITVYPLPSVYLTYSLPKYVRAEEPFLLGVRATNTQYGTAHNLRIQSALPEIIDQAEKPVSFEIQGTFENGVLHPGDLLLNFGNLGPNQTKTGGWMMVASYHGEIIDWSYRCEHLDYQGMTLSRLVYCTGGDNVFQNNLQYLSTDECSDATGAQKQGFAGGPINTRSGNYHYATEDLSLPTVSDALQMERSYDSSNVVSDTTPFSPGWTHRYAMHLEFPILANQEYFTALTGDSQLDRSTVFYRPLVVAWLPNGSRLRFGEDGDGRYTTYPGSSSTLASQTSGETITYTLTSADDTVRIFDTEGRLRTIRDRQGNETRLSYDEQGRLRWATDVTGQRWLEFGYDSSGRLITVHDSAERQVEYGYDSAGDLTVVTDTAGLEWTYTYTGSHLLHEVRDPAGGLVERTDYDSADRAVAQEDGAGLTLTLSYGEHATTIAEAGKSEPRVHRYDLFGTLVSDVDSMQNDESYEYNGDYQRVRSVDAMGHVTLMEWNSCCGQLSSITDPLGHVTRMDYDQHGNLLSRTDALDRATTYEYAGNRLTRVTDPLGGTTSYTYNDYGQVLSVADANSNTTRYGYDELGQRVVMTDAMGTVTTYGYDPAGQLITTTTAAGTALQRATRSEYDDGSRLTRTIENYWAGQAPGYLDQYNLITTFEYDPAGHLITTTTAAGTALERIVVNRYEGSRLVETTKNYRAGQAPGYLDQYNLITTYGYDPAGHLVTTTVAAGTPLQRITVNEYDDSDRLVKTTDNYRADRDPGYLDQYNLITEYTYDAAGNQLQVTSPDGRATRYGYDDLNRQITVTENYLPGAPQNYQNEYYLLARYGYDPVGNRVSTTNTLGIVTRYEYDDADRVERQAANYVNGIYDPLHPDEDVLTRFGYDLAGNQVVVTDTLGRPTLYGYDDLNRLVTVTNALGDESVSVYDAAGNRVLAIDAEQHSTAYEYDRLGRIVIVTRTAGTEPYTTTYAYDLLGNRLREADAEHHSTWYAYDSLGRAITVTDALENETYQTYDLLGNRVRSTDALLRSTEYGYDSLGRLVVITNTLDARPITTTYAFDVAGNRTAVTDALGHRTAYGYDSLGRVITVTDAALNSTTYAYDPAGNRTSTTDAEGITTCYGYDDLSRLNAVTENCVTGVPSTPMTNVLTVYTYDGAGHRLGVTDARGHITAYDYDELDRLSSVTDPLNNVTRYGYDRVGNRTVMTDANEAVTTYVYDYLYRLASIHYPDAVDEFAYDKVGNRLAMTDTTGTTLYEYDDLYRLAGMTDGQSQAVGYGYDRVGNRTVITYPGSLTVTYGYDPLNRLETVTDWDGGVTRYAYDDAGRLIGVSRPDGIQTGYGYDAAGHLIELSHARGGQLLARYVYNLDRVGNRVRVTETLLYPAPSMDGAAGLPPQLMQADDAPLDADRIAMAYGLPKPAAAATPELSATLPIALPTGKTSAAIEPVAIASLWPAVYVADTWGAAAPTWPLEPAQTTPTPPPTSTLTPTLSPPPTPAPSLTPTDVPTDEPTPRPSATAVLTPTATPTPSIEPTGTPSPAPTQLPTETPVPLPTPTEPGPPASVIVQLERATLAADGRSSVLLVALVLDDHSNPVIDGTPVQLLATGGQVSPTEAQTAGGLVFARFQAGTESGMGHIDIQAGGVAVSAELTLAPLPAGQARLDDGSLPPDAPLPFDLQEVVERARNQVQIPDRGLPFVERLGHRATFDAGSLRFASRGGSDLPGPVTTTIELAGVYVGGQPLFEGPAPAVPDIARNGVRFERAPGLAEEYLARDGGIEQRLRIDAQPSPAGDLRMAVEVQTPLDLAPAEGGEGFVFRWIGPQGERMVPVASYGRALALDADGRAKRATLSAEELAPTRPGTRRYRLEMTFPANWLAAAHYPVVVDPLIGGLLQSDVVPGTQSMPAVAYNSTDGKYLVVWQDNRGGNYDIYGQLVDSDGLLSGQNLAIRVASGDQTLPDVAYNSVDDTYLVAWRSGTTSIRAQRIDASGSLVGSLLDLTGMLLNTADHPAVAYSASAGYWLISWQQWAGSTNENDVRARAVSGAGSMATAFTVYSATGNDTAPDVAANGSQGFLVAWEREGTFTGIYARRTTATTADGDAFGVASGLITSKVAPKLTYNADDDQYLAAWQDLGTSYDTVWGRRIRGQYDVSGQFVGDAFQVSDAGQTDCGSPAVTYLAALGGENGRYLVAWEQGAGAVDLYARWVLTDGMPSGSFTLSDVGNRHEDIALAFGPAMTSVLAAWTDGRAGNSDVYARLVETGGELGEELVVHPAPGDQQVPQVAYNPDDDEYLVVWQDYRQGTSNADVYAQRVTGDGLPAGGNIVVSAASYHQVSPLVAYATEGQVYLVVWRHYPGSQSNYYDVYGQLVSRTGGLLGSPLAIANDSGPYDQETPTDVVYNSTSDRFLVLWADRNSSYWETWGRHVAPDGTLSSPIQITFGNNDQEDSAAGAYDADDDRYLVVWEYRASPGAVPDLHARRMTGSGVVTTTETIEVSAGTGAQQAPDTEYLDAAGRFVAVWEDTRDQANSGYDVYEQLVTPGGALDGSNTALAVNTHNERFPRLALGEAGGALVVWGQGTGSGTDLHGRWLSGDGRAAGEGFVVVEAEGNQDRPVAVGNGAGGYLLAWQDDRNGNWDIYGSLFAPLRAGFSATPTVGIAPLRVEFTDESAPIGAADEWRLSFGDGAPGASSAQHPVYTYTQGGVYTVTQWVTDTATGEAAVITRTRYITVYQGVEAGFTAWPTSGVALLTVAFTNTTSGDYAASLWRFGDGLTSTLNSPQHVYAPGVYTVTLTASGPGGTDTVTYTHYISVSRLATTTIVYGYDPLYRLTSAVYSSGEVYTYTYDPVGNRVAMGANGQVITYTYDMANRLTRVGQVVYTWDDNGNLLADGVRTYEYDHANRLVAVVSGTVATTFAYNGDGHRMSETLTGVTTTYVVAVLGLPQVLVETTGSEVTRYVFGQDLLAEHDGTAWAFHLDDGLGSVRQLADDNGQITLAQGYAPYGKPLWSEGSDMTGFGFTGERWDSEAQLLYLRARYYDPSEGRFITRDPWEGDTQRPITLHGWVYGENNPVTLTDPGGLNPLQYSLMLDLWDLECSTPPTGPEYAKVWGVESMGTIVFGGNAVLTHNHYWNKQPGEPWTYDWDRIDMAEFTDWQGQKTSISRDKIIVDPQPGLQETILWLPVPLGAPATFGQPDELSRGDSVEIAYRDANHSMHILSTIVLRKRLDPGGWVADSLNLNAIINEGDSGGGLFKDGQLIGNSWYIWWEELPPPSYWLPMVTSALTGL